MADESKIMTQQSLQAVSARAHADGAPAPSDLLDLKGRNVMVTGAGQGVGRAIALGIARSGAGAIIVNDINEDRATKVAGEIEALGVRAWPMAVDVGDLDAVRAGIGTVEAALGPIAILVNNAGNGGAEGFSGFPVFWESDPAHWHRYLHVNLFGVMNCCHALLPSMVAQRYGRVVTIISDAARNLEARQAEYSAAKAGAAGFMRSIAADAARHGITANCVAIATMRPDMAPAELGAFLAADRTRSQLARYPIRRFGLPEDVVATVLLLCSDASSWTTGQTYAVNGGYSSSL
ncbi:SDR family NAD(P)-dependent oxidoreductase [Sphingomonas sp. BIUV-7]|uniref:SDR family NAD(P)-dependent oxidoreductase n=1 Tax=Sphingomonas natans TaxID=3063330 RepID=A0ABT8Y868_9SPHN|nr:SDR family NAD(P)-dependent oxidoreductase [Sphingomonas sp. BIUV-7]MDO6414521.1 SDR family NAD(P)-dependent oxidoreductase [Sphingomonas sp. BIUV-7]